VFARLDIHSVLWRGNILIENRRPHGRQAEAPVAHLDVGQGQNGGFRLPSNLWRDRRERDTDFKPLPLDDVASPGSAPLRALKRMHPDRRSRQQVSRPSSGPESSQVERPPSSDTTAAVDTAQLKRAGAAKEFEALLVGEMLRAVPEEGSGWFGTGEDQSSRRRELPESARSGTPGKPAR